MADYAHPARRTVGQDRQKCKETSNPLADKQQKTGENVENIKFSLDTQLNFMFSTFSPVFCCLSARRLEVSLHFWQSWPTVGHHRIIALNVFYDFHKL